MASKESNLSPYDIENKSMKFIEKSVDLKKFSFSEEELPVVKRIIHATGDLEIGKDIKFSNGAVKKGVEALRNGSSIITDVNMVKTGIDKRRLKSFGGDVFCRIDKAQTHKESRDTSITRAASAIYSFEGHLDNQVIAIGNAPTALFAVLHMIEKNIIPALIIGVPVGFIGAKESKEALLEVSIPSISIQGFKGGSPIACAAVNALLRLADSK